MLAALLGISNGARAEERDDLEKLRATVLGLIDVLVKSGALPRDRVDGMMREAESRANARLAQNPAPEAGADGKKVVRVAYVPEALKVQLREQIKAEVLAETKQLERRDDFGATEARSRFTVEGDVRLRFEALRPNSSNTPAANYALADANLTRAPKVWGDSNNGIRNANTQEDTYRERIRARLGVTAAIADTVTAGIAISTGSTTGPTSTNQTMAQGSGTPPLQGGFNKYNLVVDRAYIKYEPRPWVSFTGGRFRNPFFGTDLVWADDLNFEGFAVSMKPLFNPVVSGFVNAGWFPLSNGIAKQSRERDLLGVQGGVDWKIGLRGNNLKVSAALYNYRNIEGIAEDAGRFASAPDYLVRSDYGSGYRQSGNTLFRLNAPTDFSVTPTWGLASRFREVNLTATLDVAQFDPMHVIVTADLVKNLGFKRDEMAQRTGFTFADGKGLGYMGRVQVGAPQMAKLGDWNFSLAYRYLGSDAVLDAFTNSDFGLGGTNNKGTILGANFGIAKNTWVSARWLSSDQIDSFVPATAAGAPLKTKLSLDLFQVDLNARF